MEDDHVVLEVQERKNNEKKADKRHELFKLIMIGQQTNCKWIELLFGLSGIVLVGFILTIPLTLIPYHDLVRFPEFWYEHLFLGAYSFAIIFVWRAALSWAYMNCDELLLPRNIRLMTLSGITYILLFLVSSYYV